MISLLEIAWWAITTSSRFPTLTGVVKTRVGYILSPQALVLSQLSGVPLRYVHNKCLFFSPNSIPPYVWLDREKGGRGRGREEGGRERRGGGEG